MVLGGSGGVGSAVARLLAQEAVAVRAVNRTGKIPFLPRRVQVAAAEAVVPETLRPVCAGATVIYHCIHPTRDYDLLVPITRHVIDAAAEVGALLVVPGNVQVYGKVDGAMTEDLPFRSTGRNGKVYIRVAELLREAHTGGRLRVVVGRTAHCYGPYVRRIWPGTDFDAALAGKANSVVGNVDAPHTYLFVEDFARSLIRLASSDDAIGKSWHVAAPAPITMRDFLKLMYEELRLEPMFRRRNSLSLFLGSLVNQEEDRLREMRYQFERPFVVDASRFAALFELHTTPHSEGIRRTIDWYLRLEEQARAAAPKR